MIFEKQDADQFGVFTCTSFSMVRFSYNVQLKRFNKLKTGISDGTSGHKVVHSLLKKKWIALFRFFYFGLKYFKFS